MKRVALAWALAVALVAPLFFDRIYEADLGFHLALGRLTLAAGPVHTNALSWIAGDHPWQQPSWLYDALVAWTEATGGLLAVQLLSLLSAAAALGSVGVAAHLADRRRGEWIAPAIALVLLPSYALRPHLFSWAVLGAVLALCLAAREGRPWLRFACLPLVAIGNNLHAGAAFAAGVLGLFALEALWRERRRSDAALLFLAPASLLVLPGGPWNLQYLLLNVAPAFPVREMQRGAFASVPMLYAMAALALPLALRDARKEPALLAATLVLFVAALLRARLSAEFAIVAAPTLARGLGSLRAGVRWGALAGLGLAAAIAGRWDARVLRVTPGARFDETALPVRAARFIAAERLDGRLHNSFDDGGYLEYALPALPVFLDGRVQAYPPALLREAALASRSPQTWETFLRSHGVEWSLVQRLPVATAGEGLLDANPGWALVYWDEVSAVFLRRDVQRFGPLIARNEYRYFRPDGRAMQTVGSGDGPLLHEVENELERYERSAPDDVWPALVRCEIAARRGLADADRSCDRAMSRAGSDRTRHLVEVARRVPRL